ncbi:ParB-like protein [Roseobacter litoralis Och 149]|uniref:ParB-like protein n=1 Tax=Roseobacter litoralis (strain ATCC 49566 / DSM 6996 / JCM 21268 / NBRC 15278 / OCh 149) TaxID=391595 RepID=F7ZL26_ROSLO|nr:ParB-like protein [Roseobacter litoralis Och 149]
MTKQQKITLSASRDIPFNKLMLSQSNVRHVKAGVSIEELAEDIARRTLLSSITVRPVLDDSGAETGMYTIPAGGRRFRALELLVKQKRMNKTALVPCIVRTDGLAEEDSLAENVQRAPLHPLDQFRAFQAMREKGRTEEEIAAAFFVSASVVKQRLKLAAVAPSLLDAYAEEEMTLDQLMAFTVNPDHARQEQVWDARSLHGHGPRVRRSAQNRIEGAPQETRSIEATGYRSWLSICEIVSLLADRIAHGSHIGPPYLPQFATESIRSSIGPGRSTHGQLPKPDLYADSSE